MTVRVVSVRRRRLAVFMVSTALASALSVASTAQAQQTPGASVAVRSVQVSIPSQPLDRAISAFIRQTGVQVGYATALVAGKTSTAVSGRLDPIAALRTLLSGSGIGIQVTGARTVSLIGGTATNIVDDGSTVLDTITVTSRRGLTLGTDSVADSGTTSLDSTQLGIRTDGGGDANTFLRGLPNVQYQNDTEDEGGVDGQDILNLRPLGVSISGGRTYENNFILDGIGINTVTGTVEQIAVNANGGELSDTLPTVNANRIYGLHAQTIFVPDDFIDSATVIDSNAPAEFGSFQGGVVEYKLKDPAKDRWRSSVSVGYQNDDMVRYNVGTEDGTNPNAIDAPEFVKHKASVSVSGPVTDNISMIGQYSHSDAWTEKARDYIYGDDKIESTSRNDFYRLQFNAETDFGLFKLEGLHTDYNQEFQHASWRDLKIDVATQSYALKLENEYEFEDFSLGGVPLSDVKLTSRVTASKSDTLNLGGDDIARGWTGRYSTGGRIFNESTLDWCRFDPSRSSWSCNEGGNGSERGQGQKEYKWAQEVTGDVATGSFKAGYEIGITEAHRWRARDYISYTYRAAASYPTLYNNGFRTFICNTTEECTSEQFAASKGVAKAFDVTVEVLAANSYLELDQTFGWLNLRPGIRLDYDDYQDNMNVAPRLVATLTPTEELSITGGYNRYYNGASLSHAIRDQQPRTITYTRNPSNTTSIVGDFGTATQTYYTTSASNLKTPYTDELSAAISWTDPLTDGQWRFRYIDRQSKDQYASITSNENSHILTNTASGEYQSFTGEYVKDLPTLGLNQLDNAAISASLTWSANSLTSDSYFADEDDLEERIYYKGQSYTQGGFNVVTGNMDIPLRAQMGLTSRWFEDRLQLGVAANYNFAYRGVEDTEDTITVDGINHAIWEDKDFSAVLTVDLIGSYKVWQGGDGGLTLNFKVSNLFNELGNAKADTDTPWVAGRTLWVGASAEF